MDSARRPLVIATLACSLLLTACVGFERNWQRAQRAHPAPHRGLEGVWEGSWKSGANGHSGGLRCIVRKTGADRYEFYYWATWARVLSGGFKIEVEAVEKDGKWSFSGDKDLGKLGGAFSHEGEATAQELKATFKSDRGDHGTFQLTRPKGEG